MPRFGKFHYYILAMVQSAAVAEWSAQVAHLNTDDLFDFTVNYALVMFSDDIHTYAFAVGTEQKAIGRWPHDNFTAGAVQVLKLGLDQPTWCFSAFRHASYWYVVESHSTSARILRFDTIAFDQIEVMDLALFDPSLSRLVDGGRAFWGGFADEQYGYTTPRNSGKVARFRLDTFSDAQFLDLSAVRSDLDQEYYEGFADGPWGYLVPFNSGRVVRFRRDTLGDVEVLDVGAPGFHGAFVHDNFAYLTPNSGATVIRFSLITFTEFQAFSLAATNIQITHGGAGAFNDDVYGYVATFFNPRMLRFRLDFSGEPEELVMIPGSARHSRYAMGSPSHGYLTNDRYQSPDVWISRFQHSGLSTATRTSTSATETTTATGTFTNTSTSRTTTSEYGFTDHTHAGAQISALIWVLLGLVIGAFPRYV